MKPLGWEPDLSQGAEESRGGRHITARGARTSPSLIRPPHNSLPCPTAHDHLWGSDVSQAGTRGEGRLLWSWGLLQRDCCTWEGSLAWGEADSRP